MSEFVGSNSSTHQIGSGNSATRIFRVPWANRLSVAESLLGSAHPSIPHCWCNQVKIEPFPGEAKAYGGAGEISYDLAKITAEYATDFAYQPWPIPKPPFRQGTGLSIMSIQSSGEWMRLPARAVRWEDNENGYPGEPLPEDDSPAGRILVRKAEYLLLWDYVDNPPLNSWNEKIGKVNSGAFLGCPQETLLFLGYELAPSTRASITSPWCWKLVAKFSYRGIKIGQNTYGWNHEYRPDGWKRVKMNNGSGQWVDRYQKVDFSGMFA